jgi:hypothetical protein
MPRVNRSELEEFSMDFVKKEQLENQRRFQALPRGNALHLIKGLAVAPIHLSRKPRVSNPSPFGTKMEVYGELVGSGLVILGGLAASSYILYSFVKEAINLSQ